MQANNSTDDDDDHDDDDNKDDDDKKYQKVRDHCHYIEKFRRAARNICNLKSKTPKEVPEVFHNSFTYGYPFIIRRLAKEFHGQLKCLLLQSIL